MLAEWLAGLEATALARGLRGSVWAYPLVNAGHVAGVALLVGSIVPLDLRLLGAWRSIPLAPLWRVLTRTAGVGLALAVVCGALLFTTRATEYAHSGLFVSKMIIVAVAAANALALGALAPADVSRTGAERAPRLARASAALSLVAWPAALTLGRLVGYF